MASWPRYPSEDAGRTQWVISVLAMLPGPFFVRGLNSPAPAVPITIVHSGHGLGAALALSVCFRRHLHFTPALAAASGSMVLRA
jgi:hypothetical protein